MYTVYSLLCYNENQLDFNNVLANILINYS